MKTRTRGWKFTLPLVLGVGLVAGCSTISTEPDQRGLHYEAGPWSDTTFENCVNPGTRNVDGPGDDHYRYPAGQRTYDFSGGNGAESGPIEIVSKDNLAMKVRGVMTFELNGNCQMLKKFHEQIGLKYHANVDDNENGWDKMLAVYLKQPLARAMNQVSKQFNWADLYSNPKTKRQWEEAVIKALPTYVRNQAGDDYFVKIGLTLQQPNPPAKVVSALTDAQEAVQQAKAAEQQNKKIDIQAKGIKDLVKVLGPQGYVLYKAIEDGRIKVVVADGATIKATQ